MQVIMLGVLALQRLTSSVLVLCWSTWCLYSSETFLELLMIMEAAAGVHYKNACLIPHTNSSMLINYSRRHRLKKKIIHGVYVITPYSILSIRCHGPYFKLYTVLQSSETSADAPLCCEVFLCWIICRFNESGRQNPFWQIGQ